MGLGEYGHRVEGFGGDDLGFRVFGFLRTKDLSAEGCGALVSLVFGSLGRLSSVRFSGLRGCWNTGFRLAGRSFKFSCIQGSFGEEVPQGIRVF